MQSLHSDVIFIVTLSLHGNMDSWPNGPSLRNRTREGSLLRPES